VNAPIDDKPGDDKPGDEKSESRLEQRSRELFDDSVASLDARTRSRLNQARQAALEAARGHAASGPARWLLPVGSAAALVLVVLTSVQFMRSGNEVPVIEEPGMVASTVDDLEILTSTDELEMLKDVEFYAWLETQQGMGESASSEAG
jgi:hypothetical protein